MSHYPACNTRSRFLICLWIFLTAGYLHTQPLSCPSPAHPKIFMWVGANRLMEADTVVLEDMLLFARRFDIIPYSSGMNDPGKLARFLKTCKYLKIPRTWIEIGPGKEATIAEFLEDDRARQSVLNRFRELASVYRSIYPNFARITIFDEAPLGAFRHEKRIGGRSYLADFEAFRTKGPKAFSYLYQALKSEMPAAEVGIFLHHPHNASASMSGPYSFIDSFMADTDSLGTIPDFIFSDVYRGYFNRGYGLEATNQYITDVVAHTRKIADRHGVRAYQLGQMHTIKLGYTPSKWEIDTNIKAMLKGNPHGIGWYWPNYAATNRVCNKKNPHGSQADVDVSFNPFIPNSWGAIGPAGSVWGTSRDRFVYAYLRMLEATEKIKEEERFDLWLYGYDFDHAEHRIYIRSLNDSGQGWEYLGSVNSQQDVDRYVEGADTSTIYSYADKWHGVVFHALSRKRFLYGEDGFGSIKVRIETPDGGDGSKLAAVYVMPYRATRNYATEDQITHWIEKQPRWVQINSLARQVYPEPVSIKPKTAPVIVNAW